jgi:hypothetical protein
MAKAAHKAITETTTELGELVPEKYEFVEARKIRFTLKNEAGDLVGISATWWSRSICRLRS